MPPQQLSLSSQTVALLCWCQVCSILAFCAWVSESNLLTGHPQQKSMQLYIPSSARVKLKQIGHEKRTSRGEKSVTCPNRTSAGPFAHPKLLERRVANQAVFTGIAILGALNTHPPHFSLVPRLFKKTKKACAHAED